ncbi:MAG: hypothetical protein JWM56_160 [Candidatus Peribacteria bacterium]|nr:hypothetical protein [Candidatus Peribacteria bacterium]
MDIRSQLNGEQFKLCLPCGKHSKNRLLRGTDITKYLTPSIMRVISSMHQKLLKQRPWLAGGVIGVIVQILLLAVAAFAYGFAFTCLEDGHLFCTLVPDWLWAGISLYVHPESLLFKPSLDVVEVLPWGLIHFLTHCLYIAVSFLAGALIAQILHNRKTETT